eukprot:4095534-Pyramimonas_sp.AAC.1
MSVALPSKGTQVERPFWTLKEAIDRDLRGELCTVIPRRLQLDHGHDVLRKRQCLADRPLHVAAARMGTQRTVCDLAESLVTWLN